jgi:enamine deaminase RidA (YjgF/YER057c/UK114 family)
MTSDSGRVERIDPPGLLRPTGGLNTHVAITSSRTAWINGQVARDVEGGLVGEGDRVAQARQCWQNLRTALAGIGATGHDVVNYRTTVVGLEPEHVWPIIEAGRDVFGDEWPVAPSIMVGATALGRPEYLVEIEAVAAVA